jgi:hypothetical protein
VLSNPGMAGSNFDRGTNIFPGFNVLSLEVLRQSDPLLQSYIVLSRGIESYQETSQCLNRALAIEKNALTFETHFTAEHDVCYLFAYFCPHITPFSKKDLMNFVGYVYSC